MIIAQIIVITIGTNRMYRATSFIVYCSIAMQTLRKNSRLAVKECIRQHSSFCQLYLAFLVCAICLLFLCVLYAKTISTLA